MIQMRVQDRVRITVMRDPDNGDLADTTEVTATVTRVWDRPASDPLITVRTDDGRTFTRCSSRVLSVIARGLMDDDSENWAGKGFTRRPSAVTLDAVTDASVIAIIKATDELAGLCRAAVLREGERFDENMRAQQALANRAHVRATLARRFPRFAAALIAAEILVDEQMAEDNAASEQAHSLPADPPSCTAEEFWAGTAGFGDLDYEHGAPVTGPRYGSDEVL